MNIFQHAVEMGTCMSMCAIVLQITKINMREGGANSVSGCTLFIISILQFFFMLHPACDTIQEIDYMNM